MSLSDLDLEDLANSGLIPQDMDIREAASPEFAAVGLPSGSQGYVIPYFDLFGKIRAFYRLKLFGQSVKYKQPKNTSNHVYFPKKLQEVLKNHSFIIICEGEKKAASVVKAGYPAVALGGVDSWKNRILNIPEGSNLAKGYDGKSISVKLPTGAAEISESGLTILATGFMELIDLVVARKLHILVAFDSDEVGGLKFEVQRAASVLAFELRYRGIPFGKIHQLQLPFPVNGRDKIGIDDFLLKEGVESLGKLIDKTLNSGSLFPRHPNIREFINRKLQKTKLQRKETQHIAMAILSDLDASGRRLKSTSENQAYYFDSDNRRLIKASMNMGNKGLLHETPFGQLLYKRYGLSAADQRILVWLDAQFHGELPINEVSPHRVIARANLGEDCVRYQLNDGQYAKVTADLKNPIEILDNGADGFLFEANQVQPIVADELLEAMSEVSSGVLKPWWTDVLDTVRLKDDDKNKILVTLLFYLSPWLYKWRNMQLPIELVIGESGSGKSSLCEHRLNILTGNPELRNAPTDLKDWHASISNTGALHVTDNVQLMDKSLRQRLSDEICRLITESHPHIEMRKLYSNNELIRIPVSTTFAITAIQQPFMQADLLQRAILIELDQHPQVDKAITFEASWVPQQMSKFGGRTRWIAHHLHVVHKFFTLVEAEWDSHYVANHRLINLEQSLILMGKVFGMDCSWIPKFLAQTSHKNISESDWALEGICSFVKFINIAGQTHKRFSAGDIADWASGDEEYMDCAQIINSRRLGRYIQSHKHMIAQIAGLQESGRLNNKIVYSIVKKKYKE